MTTQNVKYPNIRSKDMYESTEANDWQTGSFEKNYGCLQGELSDREPQGNREQRLKLDDARLENIN